MAKSTFSPRAEQPRTATSPASSNSPPKSRPRTGGSFGTAARFNNDAGANPGPGTYDVVKDASPRKGWTFAQDSRDRQFKLELSQLGQSPGPVYNITPSKIISVGGGIGHRLPVPEKEDTPGPGQYSPEPLLPPKATTFTWGDGRTKSRFLPTVSDSPGPHYNISPSRSPRSGFTMGTAPRDAAWKQLTASSVSPGPVYDVAAVNARQSPRYSFGTRTYVRNMMEDVPGPIYNIEPPQSTRGGAVMRPPSVRKVIPQPPASPPKSPRESPSPSKSRPTPTFSRETRTAYYDRLTKQVASPGPVYDVSTATQRKGPSYTLRARHENKDVDIGPGAAAYDIRNAPGKEAKAFSFGKDARDREFNQMIKNSSCSPGPRYNIASPVKMLSTPFSNRAWGAGSGMSIRSTPPMSRRRGGSPRQLQWMSPSSTGSMDDDLAHHL